MAAAGRGVKVRLLLDIPATMAPEPLGQGIPIVRFYEGVAALRDAHAEVVTSSFVGIPDRVTPPTDPEYRDRLELHQEYIANSVSVGVLGANAVLPFALPNPLGRGFIGTEFGQFGDGVVPALWPVSGTAIALVRTIAPNPTRVGCRWAGPG